MAGRVDERRCVRTHIVVVVSKIPNSLSASDSTTEHAWPNILISHGEINKIVQYATLCTDLCTVYSLGVTVLGLYQRQRVLARAVF